MKNKQHKNKGTTQAQAVALALAFVGEHREQFEQWLKEKGEKKK